MIKRGDKVKYKNRYYFVHCTLDIPSREPLVMLTDPVTKDHFSVSIYEVKATSH